MNTLLIEDDPNVTELASYMLGAAGHAVEIAHSAADARRLDVAAYDLIVVDLGLPDADGVDLVRELRSQGCCAAILVCSAFAGDPHQRDARDAGCDFFLAKPFRRQQLLEAVALARRAAGARSG